MKDIIRNCEVEYVDTNGKVRRIRLPAASDEDVIKVLAVTGRIDHVFTILSVKFDDLS